MKNLHLLLAVAALTVVNVILGFSAMLRQGSNATQIEKLSVELDKAKEAANKANTDMQKVLEKKIDELNEKLKNAERYLKKIRPIKWLAEPGHPSAPWKKSITGLKTRLDMIEANQKKPNNPRDPRLDVPSPGL